jgi:hypothetical protein
LIKNKNRSYYIGASDTKFVVGNWETKTFEKWWLEKLNLNKNNYTNVSMMAGTWYEHKILDSLNIKNLKKDKQVKRGRLRVNLDGNTKDTIYEVKTYKHENGFKALRTYEMQVQVQMYATGIKNAYIVSYGLVESDYKNYFNKIDKSRLSMHKIEYEKGFIEQVYLPRLKYLEKCLKKGIFPIWNEV